MKKFFILNFIILVFLSLFQVNTLAGSGVKSNTKLFVSPNLKVLEFQKDQPSINSKINVTNGFDIETRVELETAVVKIIDGKIGIIENKELEKNVRIRQTNIVLKPGESMDIAISIDKPEDFIENNHPAIVTREVGDGTDQEVNINPQIISIFLLENINSKVEFDINFSIIKNFIFSPEYTVVGEIINTGERVITPSGVINIYKQNTAFQAIELTSDIYAPLLPGQKIEFERQGSLNFNDPLKETGQFTFEVEIKPNPFSNTLKETKNIFHFNRNVFIVIVTTSVVSLILIFFLTSIVIDQEKRVALKKKVTNRLPFRKNQGIVKQESAKTNIVDSEKMLTKPIIESST